MTDEEVVKISNEFEKEAEDIKEKYKNFDFKNSTDLNEKIDFLYDFMCVLGIEINNVAAKTSAALEKISEAL